MTFRFDSLMRLDLIGLDFFTFSLVLPSTLNMTLTTSTFYKKISFSF